MDLTNLPEAAQAAGFTHAAPLSVDTLRALPAVRDACAVNKCGKFGACWTCPPAAGTLAECEARMRAYRRGLLVQTVGALEDCFDYESIKRTEALHQRTFAAFAEPLRESFPDLLALSSGGCTICARCSYPDAPCRFPGKAFSSMEAYGLLVSDVCRDNGLAYYYGKDTVAFTGCYLWDRVTA